MTVRNAGKASDVRRDLRRRSGARTTAIDKIIVQDIDWIVSALLQLLELRRGVPAEGHMAALPAVIKYGVGSPAAY
ncbi:hypothetical protein [Streptomyces sp. CRB46]|uniref:hypothetical protein n=1 Tax=Streptomyces sp. CRB46 TaxID=2682613 RepID=UPI0018F748D4|nr:hypothetical protein [Streptomyces sp. CRB46]